MKIRILLIGAGEIGSRYLQGFARSKNLTIMATVVDGSLEAQTKAQGRLQEVEGWEAVRTQYHSTLGEIAEGCEFDLIILATSSIPRHGLMKTCLSRFNCKRYVLEKVVFTSSLQYEDVMAETERLGVRCWVNTSKRYFPAFQFLESLLAECSDRTIEVEVDSGALGIGCNSIHFLDLTAYWSNATMREAKLDISEIIDSKRSSYKEIVGKLEANFDDKTSFVFKSSATHVPWVLKLKNKNFMAFVHEGGTKLLLTRSPDWKWETLNFKAPYQSEITENFLHDLFLSNKPLLATLEQVYVLDSLLLNEIQKKMSAKLSTNLEFCPIT
jgi:Oxidoreductase family, NAD-binding Rossmann fold